MLQPTLLSIVESDNNLSNLFHDEPSVAYRSITTFSMVAQRQGFQNQAYTRSVCRMYTFLWNTKFYMKCYTAQKMKFPIKDFSSKCDEIRSFLQIWSHLPGKSFMENIIFYTCYMCRLNSFWVTFSYFSIMAFFRLTKISHVSFLDIGIKTKAGNHRKFLFFVYRTLVYLVPNFLIKTWTFTWKNWGKQVQ